jgi:hypothetical protein
VTDRIATVSRQHDLFRLYKDHIRVENLDDFRAQITLSGGGGGGGEHTSSEARLKIIDLVKFPRPLRDIFVTAIRNNPSHHEAIDLEDHLTWLVGEGPYGECMTHSEVSASTAVSVSLTTPSSSSFTVCSAVPMAHHGIHCHPISSRL